MRVAAVGGGHGLAQALRALVRLGLEPDAVVTVADDGGSTGRLRRDLGIIAPGDLRMALLALARNRPLADLLGHRFGRGELEGHALGNLALVALAEQHGADFLAALDAACHLLDCSGRVLPATTLPVHLGARVAGGEQVDGQARVTRSRGRVERVWLEPADPPACADAVAALERADVVVLGPGSLFTSVIATLLVPGLRDALLRSRAQVVYVGNITTQPGETAGLDARAHVDALVDHVGGLTLDRAILHDCDAAPGRSDVLDARLEHPAVRAVVRRDVAARDRDGRAGRAHDPERLAAALGEVVGLPARAGGGR